MRHLPHKQLLKIPLNGGFGVIAGYPQGEAMAFNQCCVIYHTNLLGESGIAACYHIHYPRLIHKAQGKAFANQGTKSQPSAEPSSSTVPSARMMALLA